MNKIININQTYNLSEKFEGRTYDGVWNTLVKHVRDFNYPLNVVNVLKNKGQISVQCFDEGYLMDIIKNVDPSKYFIKNIIRNTSLNVMFDKENKTLLLTDNNIEENEKLNKFEYTITFDTNDRNTLYFDESALISNYKNLHEIDLEDSSKYSLGIIFFNNIDLPILLCVYNNETQKFEDIINDVLQYYINCEPLMNYIDDNSLKEFVDNQEFYNKVRLLTLREYIEKNLISTETNEYIGNVYRLFNEDANNNNLENIIDNLIEYVKNEFLNFKDGGGSFKNIIKNNSELLLFKKIKNENESLFSKFIKSYNNLNNTEEYTPLENDIKINYLLTNIYLIELSKEYDKYESILLFKNSMSNLLLNEYLTSQYGKSNFLYINMLEEDENV